MPIITENPTIEQWKTLYDLCDKLKELQPWNYLWDVDVVEISPGDGHPSIYCSVMGRERECFGIAVYRGRNALAKYYKMLANIELPPYVAMTHQDALMLYWGDREDLNRNDRRIIKEVSHNYRGRGEWPYFRNFSPGLHPWHLSSEDADEMIIALEQLYGALSETALPQLEETIDEGKRICRIQNKITGEWSTVIDHFMDQIEAETESCHITDELLVRRLQKQNRTAVDLEFDLFYIPIPLKDKNSDRPYYPQIALLADCVKETMEVQYPLDREDNVYGISLWILTEYITQHGRPQNIYVRDEETSAIINDLCEKAEINVVISGELDILDGFIEKMMSELEDTEGEKDND